MSTYPIDKLLREMILHPDQTKRFLENPEAFTRGARADGRRPSRLHRATTPRCAAWAPTPFLLWWAWTQRVRKPADVRRFIQQYRDDVGPLGYSDFGV